MSHSRFVRIVCPSIIVTTLCLQVVAQTPAITSWNNDTLNLRMGYPSDLVQADPAQAIHDGHLTLLGIAGDTDPQLAAATHCLRPDLLLQLPPANPPQTATQTTTNGETQVKVTPAAAATILLAELDIDCLTPEEQVKSHDLLASMAEAVTKVPGMHSIAEPTWYNIGSQKVHMAAAQGQIQAQPQPQPQTPPLPQQIFTMGLSTIWNNHLLVWYFSSNSIDTLNRITKATVRFGRSAPAPLYPLSIGNASSQ
jgi:hypothetical protein